MKRKNKVPALMQPQGIRMWTQRINTMDMHMTTRSDILAVRVKRLLGVKEYHFNTKNLSLGQYGNNIEKAMANPDKIDFFCSRLHICCESQSKENERLRGEIDEAIRAQEPLKKQIKELTEHINKTITFLSKIDKTEAKKMIEDLTKSTSQITL